MKLIMNKILNLIQFLLLSGIINIYCDPERIIHLGNIPEILQIKISEAINENYRNSETTNDLFIVIQNNDRNKYNQFTNLICKLIDKYLLFDNCDFRLFCNMNKDRLKNDNKITFHAFLLFLGNLYNMEEIQKFDKINKNNYGNFSTFIKNEPNAIRLIHNKKTLPFQTIDELFLNIKEGDFKNETRDLTIIILEGNAQNIRDFITTVNLDFLSINDDKTKEIDLKIYYNQNLSHLKLFLGLKNNGKNFIDKVTKETRKNHDYCINGEFLTYYEKHFLYDLRILHSIQFNIIKSN